MKTKAGRTAIMIAAILVALLIFAKLKKDQPPVVSYTTIENKVSHSAFKNQASIRIRLNEQASHQDIETLISSMVDDIKEPNVYLYVYSTGAAVANGTEWMAMFSREGGIDNGVKFK